MTLFLLFFYLPKHFSLAERSHITRDLKKIRCFVFPIFLHLTLAFRLVLFFFPLYFFLLPSLFPPFLTVFFFFFLLVSNILPFPPAPLPPVPSSPSYSRNARSWRSHLINLFAAAWYATRFRWLFFLTFLLIFLGASVKVAATRRLFRNRRVEASPRRSPEGLHLPTPATPLLYHPPPLLSVYFFFFSPLPLLHPVGVLLLHRHRCMIRPKTLYLPHRALKHSHETYDPCTAWRGEPERCPQVSFSRCFVPFRRCPQQETYKNHTMYTVLLYTLVVKLVSYNRSLHT